MADEQLIKPRELPAAIDVFADDAIMTDDGITVSKATPVQIVNAGAPVPTQAEAIAGIDNTKRMTPLATKQVLDNVSAPAVLRAQAWAESTTAPDPSMPGSKSSRTWALEAAQSAEDAEDAADTAATNTANAITSAMQGYVSAASGSASAAATSEANAATSESNAAISAGQAAVVMAGSVRFDQTQTLTSGQQAQARNNIGLGAVATDSIVPIDRGGTGADNAASARTNIQTAWTPDGRWESWYVGPGSAGVLPSGGRWAYLLLAFVSGVQGAGLSGGTAAGGTQVAPAVAGRDYAGMRWRIS